MLKLLRRWLPQAELIVVGDNAFAALDFLAAAQQLDVTVIARLRLDAALYDPAPPYNGRGRPRKKGPRLPTLASLHYSILLFCPDGSDTKHSPHIYKDF